MWGYGMGGLWMLLVWAVVIGTIVWTVRGITRETPRRSRALEILEERYARGEIDHEEFVRRRAELIR